MKTLEQILTELQNYKVASCGHHPLDTIFPESQAEKFKLTNDILSEFEKANISRGAQTIENLCIISIRDGLNSKYTGTLCSLLNQEWHDMQEDIAMMLDEIKDPASIECLYSRAIHFMADDEFRSLSKKCIWALASIGTTEAFNKIKELSYSDDPFVKETADQYLNR